MIERENDNEVKCNKEDLSHLALQHWEVDWVVDEVLVCGNVLN